MLDIMSFIAYSQGMKNVSPRIANRRYLVRFWIGMAAYVVLVLWSVSTLRHSSPPQPLLAIIAGLPALPIIGVGIALYSYLDEIDELQRRIQVEALAFGCGVTVLLALTYGFLEENGGLPHLPTIWYFVSACVLWGIGVHISKRRHE